jgi:hypothetical protein
MSNKYLIIFTVLKTVSKKELIYVLEMWWQCTFIVFHNTQDEKT